MYITMCTRCFAASQLDRPKGAACGYVAAKGASTL